jgi:hypothetical protein
MPTVQPTRGYEKSVKKLKDPRRQLAAMAAVERFIAAPDHPSLNFERVTGTEDCWSIRATSGDRVILRRRIVSSPDGNESEIFDLLEVGSHDIYRRY